MAVGSTYSTVKNAVVTRLAERPGLNDVTILPAPPVDPVALTGESGSGKAIWIADAEGAYDNVVTGWPDLWLEETYTLKLVFQALPANSDDTQLITDQRVDEMLYEFWTQVAENLAADDRTWGVEGFVFEISQRGSFRRFTGPFTNGVLFPSRCELDLDVEGRIQFIGT